METTSKKTTEIQQPKNEVKPTRKSATKKVEKLFLERGTVNHVKKIEAVKGNVNGELIPRTEQDFVHFYLTNYAIPKDRDPVNRKEFEKTKKVMTKQEFLMCFASNFDNHFENVFSPEILYRILINLTKENFIEYFGDEVPQKLKGIERRRFIEAQLAKKQRLSLNGGNLYVFPKDFIHVPGLKDISFPENV